MHCHSICHIAQSGLVGVHIVAPVAIVVNHGTTIIDLVAVFSTEIQAALVVKLFGIGILLLVNFNGVLLSEVLFNAVFNKVIVGVYVVFNEIVWCLLKVFVNNLP